MKKSPPQKKQKKQKQNKTTKSGFSQSHCCDPSSPVSPRAFASGRARRASSSDPRGSNCRWPRGVVDPVKAPCFFFFFFFFFFFRGVRGISKCVFFGWNLFCWNRSLVKTICFCWNFVFEQNECLFCLFLFCFWSVGLCGHLWPFLQANVLFQVLLFFCPFQLGNSR